MFGVDNNLSSQADNYNNNFLLLDEGPSYGIDWSFGSPKKTFSTNFSEANTNLSMSFTLKCW